LRYLARKQNATIEPVDLQAILDRDGMICHLCGNPIDPLLPGNDAYGLTYDHVIPLSKGGAHSMENIHPAHNSCNARKRDKL
jgi:5-methylcytosine-specific restriction endonuclease McrA